VSFVSEEQIRLSAFPLWKISRRVVPVLTRPRATVSSGINVRGVSADVYYRGMKRLNQQGHVRTVLSRWTISKSSRVRLRRYNGMGKIGGYSVMDPSRAALETGKYHD